MSGFWRACWWGYFVLQGVASVSALLIEPASLRSVALATFFGVGLFGLWGYLRNVRIGARRFWVAYFWLLIVGAGTSTASTLWHALHSDAVFLLSLLLLAVVCAVPSWVAIWRYASPGNPVWAVQPVA